MMTCARCGSLGYEIGQQGMKGRAARALGMVLFECYECRTEFYVHTRIPTAVVRCFTGRAQPPRRVETGTPAGGKERRKVEVRAVRWSWRTGLVCTVRVMAPEPARRTEETFAMGPGAEKAAQPSG